MLQPDREKTVRAGTSSPDERAPVLPSALPGIDVKAGLARLLGNETVYRKLLVAFSENRARIADEIAAALERKDRETAERLAHTLKGTAGNLGAEELFRAAEGLEHALRLKTDAQVDALVDAVRNALATVVAAVRNMVPAADVLPSAPVAGNAAVEEAVRSLDRIEELLERDFSAALEELETLDRPSSSSPHAARFAELRASLDRIDTDAARRILRDIRRTIARDDQHGS